MTDETPQTLDIKPCIFALFSMLNNSPITVKAIGSTPPAPNP